MKENSIKKDIKTINNFITYFNKNIQNGNKADLTVLGEEIEALEHLLSEHKRLQEENEKLKAKIDICNWQEKSCREIIENKYISKQEIKDKIKVELKKAEKDLQEAIRLEKESKEKEGTILWWTAQIRLDERIKILEMLKGVKKDGNGNHV